ncbi:unnamed protein product [Protopolystoma xenopodis]|uniref:Uncharacterized protein n=1 Tax=Protopolystoma xenopodis TaxID=117903 RepID=A0A3S5ADH4_9PLAT|nr:unnamed protein product [Protopolystoma xenopodis]
MKRFECRFHQKTKADSSRPAVDWLYWEINADAVFEVISFDSGEKVLSFRPSYDGPFHRNRRRLPQKQCQHESSSKANRQLVGRNPPSSSGGTDLRIS